MPFLRSRPELLSAFRDGDRDALSQVYWAYIDRVEAYVRKTMPWGHAEIKDVIQDAFIRAFDERARLSYDGLRDYGPYLCTICRNLIVDRARKRGREVPTEDGTMDETAEAPPSSGGEVPWADAATIAVVETYLSSLDPALRQVHEERYVKGIPQREAAERLGISRQQLRTREGKLRDGLSAALRKAGVRG
jgi:RNA polymerase sigma-70 factor (ECF subfamily)